MARFVCAIIASAFLSSVSFGADTIPGEQAEKNGVKTCQPAVEKIANHLTRGNKHSSIATWNTTNANSRAFNAQVGVEYSDGNSFAVLTATPTPDGKCDSTYTTVFTQDVTCAVARETTYKDWKFHSEFAGILVLENDSGGLTKVLLPLKNGCTAITTEVLYE